MSPFPPHVGAFTNDIIALAGKHRLEQRDVLAGLGMALVAVLMDLSPEEQDKWANLFLPLAKQSYH